MNQEMIVKIEEMVASGKITMEQKETLLKALEEINQNDVITKNELTTSDKDSHELNVQLVDEDIELIGNNESTEVEIIKGAELVDVTKSENSILIQTKKENTGIIKQLFKSHEILRQKNGIIIHHKSNEDEVIIHLPKNMKSRIKTVSGDIQIQNLLGEITVKSVSGDITLKSHNNKASLHSISGDIQIQEMRGTLECTSKSGDITIKLADIKGEVKTYSGDIQFNSSTLANMEISVFSGDIAMEQTSCGQLIQCKTFSGDMDLELTNSKGFVKGATTSGEMELINSERAIIDLANHEYGDPGCSLQIQLKTLSGDAKISFTKEE